MAVNDVIAARCQQSRDFRTKLEQLRPAIQPCCRRHDFAVCSVDLALEHQRAIVRLVEAGELGSAAALQRPLLEAAASASWLVYAASDETILGLPTDPTVQSAKEDLPMLGKLADDLLPYFPAMATLIQGLAKKGNGAALWLHKYTHGGTPQLARRDLVNGWTERDVIAGLIRSEMFAVAAVSVLTVLYDTAPFKAHVFAARNALAVEMNVKFHTAIPGDLPHQLPTPDKACCGSPLFMA